MNKKYIKPDIKDFPISTAYGQTEGICWSGGTAEVCNSGSTATGSTCQDGVGNQNVCSYGPGATQNDCVSGVSAQG